MFGYFVDSVPTLFEINPAPRDFDGERYFLWGNLYLDNIAYVTHKYTVE